MSEAEVKQESAIIVLNPSESKRLIARAVAVLPEIKAVLKKGTLVINMGTTTAYVAEEILGMNIPHKSDCASGVIAEGELNANHPDTKVRPHVVTDGKLSDVPQWQALRNFRPGDVFVKGANALDTTGDVGIMTAHWTGGSIANAWYAITGCGGHFICPVGLEKLVPSVEEASKKCNVFRFKYSTGLPVSLLRFSNAMVITEIEAISILTGASSTHVASGGIGGSEGAVVLVLEGDAKTMEKSMELIKSIKGETPVPAPRQYSSPKAASLNYDAAALSETNQFVIQDPRIYRT